MKYLAQKDSPEFSAGEILSAAIDRVEAARKQERTAREVPVYRQHQPQWTSPCMLGNPCEVCKAHESRKKPNTVCPLAKPTEPAFMVPIKTAIVLVRDGQASFINRNTAIRLTFSKVAHLRDQSLKIDARFLEALVADHFPGDSEDEKKKLQAISTRARAALSYGWDGRIDAPVIERRADERILSFAP